MSIVIPKILRESGGPKLVFTTRRKAFCGKSKITAQEESALVKIAKSTWYVNAFGKE